MSGTIFYRLRGSDESTEAQLLSKSYAEIYGIMCAPPRYRPASVTLMRDYKVSNILVLEVGEIVEFKSSGIRLDGVDKRVFITDNCLPEHRQYLPWIKTGEGPSLA